MSTGTIVFAIDTPHLPILLFETKQHFCSIPKEMYLHEQDLKFFDREMLREMISTINQQTSQQLLPFEDLLFNIAVRVQEERLSTTTTK
jgi:hypothetical protein